MLLPILLILGLLAIWLLPDFASDIGAGPRLTGRERILCRRLAAMYPDHVILTHLAPSALTALISNIAEQQSIRGQLEKGAADFVLCRNDLSIVAVIELDDSSGPTPHRQEAAERQANASEAAGLRVVRIGTGPIPSQAELRQILR
jgi:hypothetical protein